MVQGETPQESGAGRPPKGARIAVTASAAAYEKVHGSPEEQRAAIDKSLANPALPTADGWEVAWGPVTVEENFSFVARGPLLGSSLARRYVYAIRGTVVEPWNLIEDLLDSLGLKELPWGGGGDARISDGMRLGWEHLTAARDSGRSLLEFLRDVEPGSEVIVTGHSLGAMLATVMAVYLRSELDPGVGVQPYTFAAPTAGNQALADLYHQLFGGDGRYYNDLDIVPKAFGHDDLKSIKSLYSCVEGLRCGDNISCHSLIDLAVLTAGHRYVHAVGGTRLQAQAYAQSGHSFEDFLKEALDQHHVVHYLWLLGLPLDAVRVFEPKWTPPTVPCECPDS